MGALAPELPASSGETFASDVSGMGNFFIDPAGAALRVHRKWFWIAPLIVFSIVSLIASYLIMPITRHVMEVAPIPPGATPEQFQRGMEMALTIQKVAMYFSPLIAALLFALQAGILLAMSVMTGVVAKFRELFNLIAGCSLIQALAAIAAVVILKAKGDISTVAELRPALGLDIFLPEGANKILAAILGYFSIFEIWWIIMLVLIYSIAFRVSKGKAALVITPLILLSVIMRVVGAIFQR
ncbi:MAG TPA: YIP1 family protein [Bryobacteraceae bacterium]|nr:YIP1 family protein [Bryobacteraceae bacterium]